MPRQRAYTKTQYDEEKDKESGTFQVERSKLKRHRAVLQINNNNKKEEIKRVLSFPPVVCHFFTEYDAEARSIERPRFPTNMLA